MKGRHAKLFFERLNSVSPAIKREVLNLLQKRCKVKYVSRRALEATASILAYFLEEHKKAVSWRLIAKYVRSLYWYGDERIPLNHVGIIIRSLERNGLLRRHGSTIYLRPLARYI